MQLCHCARTCTCLFLFFLVLGQHGARDGECAHERAQLQLLGDPEGEAVLDVGELAHQVRHHLVGQHRVRHQPAQRSGDVAHRVSEVNHRLRFEV